LITGIEENLPAQ